MDGQGPIYEVVGDELNKMSSDGDYAARIEKSILNEVRGREVWALHATLKAVSTHDERLTERADGLQTRLDSFEQNVGRWFEETGRTGGTQHRETLDRISAFERNAQNWISSTRSDLQNAVTGAERSITSGVNDLRNVTLQRLDRFEDATSHNFSATNERIIRELGTVQDEVTALLDKRFNHIDQTFASVRADIEVLKALVMELIKERVGRPDIKGRER